MWRPKENWRNPFAEKECVDYTRLLFKLEDGTIIEGKAIHIALKAFEAGADAMLEALNQNIRLEKHQWEQAICLIHNDGTVTIDTNPAYGKLVFIPDE